MMSCGETSGLRSDDLESFISGATSAQDFNLCPSPIDDAGSKIHTKSSENNTFTGKKLLQFWAVKQIQYIFSVFALNPET